MQLNKLNYILFIFTYSILGCPLLLSMDFYYYEEGLALQIIRSNFTNQENYTTQNFLIQNKLIITEQWFIDLMNKFYSNRPIDNFFALRTWDNFSNIFYINEHHGQLWDFFSKPTYEYSCKLTQLRIFHFLLTKTLYTATNKQCAALSKVLISILENNSTYTQEILIITLQICELLLKKYPYYTIDNDLINLIIIQCNMLNNEPNNLKKEILKIINLILNNNTITNSPLAFTPTFLIAIIKKVLQFPISSEILSEIFILLSILTENSNANSTNTQNNDTLSIARDIIKETACFFLTEEAHKNRELLKKTLAKKNILIEEDFCIIS